MKKTLLFIVIGLLIFALVVTATEVSTGGISQLLGIFDRADAGENEGPGELNDEQAYSALFLDNSITQEDAKDWAKFFACNFINSKEQAYILELVKDGYDKELVKNAVLFWFNTDKDISVIKQILEAIPEHEEEKNLIVVEIAFDKLTNNKSGQLTFQEGREYLDKYLSLDDLTYANKLSKKGYMDIHEILDKCVEDGSINSVAVDVLSRCRREKYVFSSVDMDKLLSSDAKEIFAAVELCRAGIMSIEDCFAAEQNPSEMVEQTRDAAICKADIEIDKLYSLDEEAEAE